MCFGERRDEDYISGVGTEIGQVAPCYFELLFRATQKNHSFEVLQKLLRNLFELHSDILLRERQNKGVMQGLSLGNSLAFIGVKLLPVLIEIGLFHFGVTRIKPCPIRIFGLRIIARSLCPVTDFFSDFDYHFTLICFKKYDKNV